MIDKKFQTVINDILDLQWRITDNHEYIPGFFKEGYKHGLVLVKGYLNDLSWVTDVSEKVLETISKVDLMLERGSHELFDPKYVSEDVYTNFQINCGCKAALNWCLLAFQDALLEEINKRGV